MVTVVVVVVVVWGWRVQSGFVMNIHGLLYVLPNRKWHHSEGSTHQKKKKKKKKGGRGIVREERKEETGRRKNREHWGKSDGGVREVEADGERGRRPD